MYTSLQAISIQNPMTKDGKILRLGVKRVSSCEQK
jgi:hypothetical protein